MSNSYSVKHYEKKKSAETLINKGFSALNFGCGGRTRTCDLRVMSPTSYQLLHPAIFIFQRTNILYIKSENNAILFLKKIKFSEK